MFRTIGSECRFEQGDRAEDGIQRRAQFVADARHDIFCRFTSSTASTAERASARKVASTARRAVKSRVTFEKPTNLPSVSRNASSDIWALPLTGERKPSPVTRTEYHEDGVTLSADGRWIAYHANDLGANQLYVLSFPTGRRVRISTTSGAGPVWSRDQKSIYYLTDDGQVMAADVTIEGDELRARPPRQLFAPKGSCRARVSWGSTRVRNASCC